MTMNTLDLTHLASTGQLLATLDRTQYLACHLVLAWPADGVPVLHCAYTDWATSPVARLAAKEAEIAELAQTLDKWALEATAEKQRATALERRVKELEQQLAAQSPPETPRENQEAQFRRQAAALLSTSPDPPPEPIVCPDCGKDDLKSARALQMHRQRAHEGMQAGKPKIVLLDDQGWRCAEKGCTGAFTRDLHDPVYCTAHAKLRALNGHEIAA